MFQVAQKRGFAKSAAKGMRKAAVQTPARGFDPLAISKGHRRLSAKEIQKTRKRSEKKP